MLLRLHGFAILGMAEHALHIDDQRGRSIGDLKVLSKIILTLLFQFCVYVDDVLEADDRGSMNPRSDLVQ